GDLAGCYRRQFMARASSRGSARSESAASLHTWSSSRAGVPAAASGRDATASVPAVDGRGGGACAPPERGAAGTAAGPAVPGAAAPPAGPRGSPAPEPRGAGPDVTVTVALPPMPLLVSVAVRLWSPRETRVTPPGKVTWPWSPG